MNMMERLLKAWVALTGREIAATVSAKPPSDAAARVAALELEMKARDARIAALLADAEARQQAAKGEADSAAADRMGKLLRRLAPLLAQADAMRHAATVGQPARSEDVLTLVGKIERALLDEGVARIGDAGEETAFDTRLHQRLSGGDVREGDAVRVRFVGYRQDERILVKAMVSRKE